MIEIDGSHKSGSGTIVRDAVPLAVLMGEEIHLDKIRMRRDKPGLRAQHLKAIEAAAQVCGGRVMGAEVGSKSVRFRPGKGIKGGSFKWDIGTAGSTAMLASSLIPLGLFADKPSAYKISGGLFQDFAPSIFHVMHVLLPTLRAMGIHVVIRIIRPGYVPRGNGEIEVKVMPLQGKLKPIELMEQGKFTELKGIALSSLLKERRVSDRMAEQCRMTLSERGYDSQINVLYDMVDDPAYEKASIQAGACLALWARSNKGCLIGADMAGARGRTAEYIGIRTAENLLEDLQRGATVDRHLADQIIPFAALAEGWSSYLIPAMTEHVETRLWLMEKMLGTKTEVRANLVRIQGIGYQRG